MIRSATVVLALAASLSFADEPQPPQYGTVNGLVVLINLQTEKEFYLDFQGSKSSRIQRCSCHASFIGTTTSGKSTIDLNSRGDGWVTVTFGGSTYSKELLREDEITDIWKEEGNREYHLITFPRRIILANESDPEDRIELSPQSLLMYCFSK